MRVVVIGATGHIGTYLVPRLVRAGHEVVALSRGNREPYHRAPEWDAVQRRTCDRAAEDESGTFGARIAALAPEAVVDLISFTAESTGQLVEALRPLKSRDGGAPLLVSCGTIWVHGRTSYAPVTEDDPRTGYGAYGEGKIAIERLLAEETRSGGVPSVVLHPGHISGPGWQVITPLGNLDPRVWEWLATGRTIPVPGDGTGLLHHVHADDVAAAFELALTSPDAVGRSHHVVSARAMTLRGLCAEVAGWYGREAVLEPVSWVTYEKRVGADHAAVTRSHVERSVVAGIDQSRERLGWAPRHTTSETLREALVWLVGSGAVDPVAKLRPERPKSSPSVG